MNRELETDGTPNDVELVWGPICHQIARAAAELKQLHNMLADTQAERDALKAERDALRAALEQVSAALSDYCYVSDADPELVAAWSAVKHVLSKMQVK